MLAHVFGVFFLNYKLSAPRDGRTFHNLHDSTMQTYSCTDASNVW